MITKPWPSMLRTIWGDPERYRKTYWPEDFKGKLYLAGDGASMDEDGYFRIVGRIDDVLNVSGHRLGTMEVESALVANSKLVAGPPWSGVQTTHWRSNLRFRGAQGPRPTGEEAKRVAEELRQWVAKEIGPIIEAEGHPLRRQPAEDALGQDHAAAAALDRQGRGNQAGCLDSREPGDPGAAEASDLDGRVRDQGQRLTALCLLGFPAVQLPGPRAFHLPARCSASRCSTLGFS